MQDLFNFMLGKIGGVQAAKTEYLKDQLTNMNALDMTVEELFTQAQEGGWEGLLRDLTLEEFGNLCDPGKDSPRDEIELRGAYGSKGLEFSTRTRIKRKTRRSYQAREKAATKVSKPKELRLQIIEFLCENAWDTGLRIAEKLGFELVKIEEKLKELEQAGVLKSVGECAGKRYALG